MPFCTNYDLCGNWARHGSKYCASCETQARKSERDEKRNALKPKPKAIRKVSDKRSDQLVEYSPLRKQYLIDHPKCEIKLVGCEGDSKQIHHCSMSDLDFLNTHTWKASCTFCHGVVERVLSAKERRDKGLLI